MANISFEKLTKIYNTKNIKCGNIGWVYIPKNTRNIYHKPIFIGYEKKHKKIVIDSKGNRLNNVDYDQPKYLENYTETNVTFEDTLLKVPCNNFSCSVCRPYLKNKLFINLLREIYINNISNHFIITFPGKPLRIKINYEKSYPIMLYEWDKLLHRINYTIDRLRNNKELRYKNSFLVEGEKLPNERDFAYICLPRSQNNPTENNPIGFCHLHNMINLPINKDWIDEIINKNQYQMGFTYIVENQDILDYMFNDFLKDNEWIIPFGQRHYNSSRNVIINRVDKKSCEDYKFYAKRNYCLDSKQNFIENMKFIDNDLSKDNKILPYNAMVQWLSMIEQKQDYGDLKKSSGYNKKHNDFYFKNGGKK